MPVFFPQAPNWKHFAAKHIAMVCTSRAIRGCKAIFPGKQERALPAPPPALHPSRRPDPRIGGLLSAGTVPQDTMDEWPIGIGTRPCTRYIRPVMSEVSRTAASNGAATDQLKSLLREHFDADAVWTRRGMTVARGRPVHLDVHRFLLLKGELSHLGWSMRWEAAGDDWLVMIERRKASRPPWLAIGLFLATVVAVVILRPLTLTGFSLEGFREAFLSELPFAYALFPILLAHEFGHYFAARAHDYPASLPYFIPGFYPFGTFGAIIVARYPFRDRRVLFDIAVAGPLAGFLVAIPVLWLGLAQSQWVQMPETGGLYLGDPLLMKLLASWVLPAPPQEGMEIMLGAAAFGGWAGLFVTMLNLLPFGPLDGGKTAYALFSGRQKWIAFGFWGLLALSLLYSYFWVLWLGLALIFRLPHPPTLNDQVPIGRARACIGVAVLMVFVLTFMLFPFKL